LGQHYVERHKLGWAFTVAEVGAVVVAGLAQLSFEQSEDDYNEARERYENLLDPDEIEAAQADAESAYDDMGSAESMRNAALLVAGAAVLASALDAWIRFPQVDLALGDSPAGAAGVGTGSSHAAAAAPWAGSAMASGNVGFHLSLRARF
jgi:hypothetical protein